MQHLSLATLPVMLLFHPHSLSLRLPPCGGWGQQRGLAAGWLGKEELACTCPPLLPPLLLSILFTSPYGAEVCSLARNRTSA